MMTFGKANDIWSRVIAGDEHDCDEVKAARKWFDDFSNLLGDKKDKSKAELEEAIKKGEAEEIINKKTASHDSDCRQYEDCICKFDDLTVWLNEYCTEKN